MESKKKMYWESNPPEVSIGNRKILNEYLRYLRITNRAESTIKTYKWILEQFLKKVKIPLADFSQKEVIKWLLDHTSNKKASTMALNLYCLAAFFEFCKEEGYIENEIFGERWRPRVTLNSPRSLSDEEFLRVRVAAEELSPRDKAITLFLLSSGCRSGEICHLTIKDIDLKNQTAKIKNKGRQYRTVFFSKECRNALQKYLKTQVLNPDAPLFVNQLGKSIQPKTINQITRKLGEKAGIKGPLTTSVCRSTFARKLSGRVVQRDFIDGLMVHSSMNSTNIYARLPKYEIEKIVKKVMK